MLGFHLIDNVNPPFAADYLIIRANFFDAGTHFHADHPLLLVDDTLLLAFRTDKTNFRGKLSDPSSDRKESILP